MPENWQELAHEVIRWAETSVEPPQGPECLCCGGKLSRGQVLHTEDCLIARLRARAYGPKGTPQEQAAEELLSRLIAGAGVETKEPGKLGPMEVDQA